MGVPLVALGVNPPQQPDLLGQMGKLAALRSAQQNQQIQQQQIQAGQLENQQREQELRDNQTVMQVLGKHNGDLDSALPELSSSVSAKTFLGMKKAAVELRKNAQDYADKDLEIKLKRDNMMLGLIGEASKLPPDQYQAAFPSIAAKAIEIDPSVKDHVSQVIPQDQLGHLGLLYQTQTTALAKESAERQARQEKETARHNEAMEENNVSESKLALRAAKGDQEAVAALDLLKQQKLATRPLRNDQATTDAIEAAAQSIAPMNPKDLTRLKDVASLRGDQRLLIYNRARQLNPNFSTAEVDRKVKMFDSFTNGKDGQQLQSFGTFLEHAGEASRITNEYRTTNLPLINTPLNAIRNKFGDQAYFQFVAALEPVRKEFEGFLLGGRALYGDDRKAAETILSDASSPAQIQAALKQMGHTVKARQNEIGQRFKNTMGAKMEDVLGPMSPEATEGARQIGLDMGRSAPNTPAAGGKPQGATHTGIGSADKKKHWLDAQGNDLGLAE